MTDPADKREADINDLVLILNNPQHKAEAEVPGRNPAGADTERTPDRDEEK